LKFNNNNAIIVIVIFDVVILTIIALLLFNKKEVFKMAEEQKFALYIRVSTDFQFEEGYSVDAQKEKLMQFCKLKDYKNYEFYIDGGWSGSNIDRPEMKRMIDKRATHTRDFSHELVATYVK
jgi:uncharacterized protein YneR